MATTYKNTRITAIGLMSGTSADGVDAALLTTDGESLVEYHASTFLPYPVDFQQALVTAAKVGKASAELVAQLTQYHIDAVEQLLRNYNGPAPELIGFHGHTIAHDPANKITVQIGDAAMLGAALDLPVVYDFRTADVQAGGQGAPLVPVYHQALAAGLEKPLAVVNIGGVANITYVQDKRVSTGTVRSSSHSERSEESPTEYKTMEILRCAQNDIIAFDTGPGNGLIDEVVQAFTGQPYDKSGELAGAGDVNDHSLSTWLQHPYFQQPAPKSLDRFAFQDILQEAMALAKTSLADAVATLTAFTAHSIVQHLTPYLTPHTLLVTGGGRHNQTLMQMLANIAPCPVKPVEAVGWRGDSMEAEAFAYLAVRRLRKLPVTFPGTTGVGTALVGGTILNC